MLFIHPRNILIVGYLCLLFGVLLPYLDYVKPLQGFITFLVGLVLPALAVIMTLILKILRRDVRWSHLLFVVPPAAIFAYFFVLKTQYPVINDVATNLQAPLVFPGHLKDEKGLPIPQKYSPQQVEVISRHYPELKPLPSPFPLFRTYEEVMVVLGRIPSLKIVSSSETTGRILATQKSGVFRFIDDIVISISSESDEASIINMRSRSRVGRSDFGANAKRILSLSSLLEDHLKAANQP